MSFSEIWKEAEKPDAKWDEMSVNIHCRGVRTWYHEVSFGRPTRFVVKCKERLDKQGPLFERNKPITPR